MSTVAKAISLLEMLGSGAPETALADLAKRANFDKATTRRLLVSLIAQGLVEQDETTRLYRLGAGIARLALMREAQFPFLRMAAPVIEALAAETGETVHLSEYSKRGLITVQVIESDKANRVSVQLGEVLPMHATASGIAFLAFTEERIREGILGGPLPAFTPYTIGDVDTLAEHVAAARARGHSTGSQGYEEGVLSVAAPILGADGFAIGTIAIAAPRVRIHKGDIERHGASVAAAAREIGERLFGRQPGQKRAS
ncbi:MAG: IclR family transcriptional regulator [Mesorhizobium sp.]|uniref:IclR family transcriptional regulator n=1 Tax=unclassified Mesorhizobium TaxID=325217 RepID=UPI000F75CC93|nr:MULTISPECIES: IclR family transcriptional regulator [unclassified Mesorhizobium]AZO71069.1 IclR family transcriptional regulator [Mesorhizobium sp. M1D.F.Ca.ET.043.01.1.1]RWA91270.1 MAG: IclR family transcriptional regulator [Mesorhizobium sp.]TJW78333.1 MAG: IclR family transcriptional regulator [Mesorhizobium sp.]